MTIAAQQPRITNGRVTAQPAGSPFAQSFRSLVSSQADVAWIGYAVPVVDGERVMCCFGGDTTWVNGNVVMSDGNGCCRACRLEPVADGTSMATRRPPAGTGRPGTSSASKAPTGWSCSFGSRSGGRSHPRVLGGLRARRGRPDDHWLEGVRPADSIALLESFATPADGRRDRIVDGAITAIALHGDPAADASLERLVAPNQPEAVRKKVTFWLGNARGAHGLATLRRVLKEDPSGEVRKGAVFGVSQSREAGAFDVLLGLARTDASPRIRSEAIFWLAQKAGQKVAAAITERIEQDPDTEVKKRAVFALSQMPKDEGVPLLINVARTQHEPRRAQAGDVLARPVQGSAGGGVLCGNTEIAFGALGSGIGKSIRVAICKVLSEP